MTTNPFKTDAEIQSEYSKAYDAYAKTQQAQADRNKAQIEGKYDDSQRQNYINYMMGQKDLPEQLARLGVTGGASETSALRARTNYENNFQNLEKQRNSDISSINNTLADILNTYKMTADENMRNEIANARLNRANWEQAQQEQEENRFAKTISGYDNINTIDSLINNITKTGVATWRIPYLRARRAELVGAGGGTGSGGSTRTYSYGGTSDNGTGTSGGGNVTLPTIGGAFAGSARTTASDTEKAKLNQAGLQAGRSVIW